MLELGTLCDEKIKFLISEISSTVEIVLNILPSNVLVDPLSGSLNSHSLWLGCVDVARWIKLKIPDVNKKLMIRRRKSSYKSGWLAFTCPARHLFHTKILNILFSRFMVRTRTRNFFRKLIAIKIWLVFNALLGISYLTCSCVNMERMGLLTLVTSWNIFVIVCEGWNCSNNSTLHL